MYIQHHPKTENYFYPRPPCGGRRRALWHVRLPDAISIHALRVEGDLRDGFHTPLNQNFYPRPPCGGRPDPTAGGAHGHIEFLSTPSVWRATHCPSSASGRTSRFLSTPSVWRATACRSLMVCAMSISIHALRVEGDGQVEYREGTAYYISIHALRVEGDKHCPEEWTSDHHFYPRPPCGGRPLTVSNAMKVFLFLSTPSVWRATDNGRILSADYLISIHALRVEGDPSLLYVRQPKALISIHALRVEGDDQFFGLFETDNKFLSTPSVWRATVYTRLFVPIGQISIHALRVEGDPRRLHWRAGGVLFLSTPSVWRATRHCCYTGQKKQFLSTPSVWRATIDSRDHKGLHLFLSTPSVWRATGLVGTVDMIASYFYPRPPCGGRRSHCLLAIQVYQNFYPRPPCGGRP